MCLVSQVAEAAGKVKLPTFRPKQGVHIETDPKGTAKPVASGDDTAVIEDLISQLEVDHLQYVVFPAIQCQLLLAFLAPADLLVVCQQANLYLSGV